MYVVHYLHNIAKGPCRPSVFHVKIPLGLGRHPAEIELILYSLPSIQVELKEGAISPGIIQVLDIPTSQ